MKVSGHIIDILKRKIFSGTINFDKGTILSVEQSENVPDQYILPGFIDAHIHIESSMVTPYEFAKTALGHGTVATVSDPHEIANVCGLEGVNYMIENAKSAGLKFFFGAPSCVPATTYENAGAIINTDLIDNLLARNDIWYLAEMMNWPGVLHNDPEVLAKIKIAQKHLKPVDGHAPGLLGLDAENYISKGMSTDHECFTIEEAQNKLAFGMKIIIREGSAAKNFEALHPLIGSNPDMVMFCSDDKHPDDLIEGHINLMVKRAIALGYNIFDVLKIACINPIKHYKLPLGSLVPGDPADFIIVGDLKDWCVTNNYINGELIYSDGNCMLANKNIDLINKFNCSEIDIKSLENVNSSKTIPIIKALDGSLITEKNWERAKVINGLNVSDIERDILKICVINRYTPSKPAVGFIQGFGLKGFAIASTVAHDSHNLIALGDDDGLICKAVNLLVQSKGGLAAVSKEDKMLLELPIAGLMSDRSVIEIGKTYEEISAFVKNNGCKLSSPFMTLSFMALLVIPKIKISDLGMFDAETFTFY